MMMADPMAGQLTYTMVAIMSSVMITLDLYRYNDASTRYSEWDNISASPGTNYWQYACQLASYSSLAFWMIASITSLLAINGIAADINMMVWMQGGAATAVLSLISHVLQMLAYDTVFTAYSQDNSGGDATIGGYITAATTIKGEMELDMVKASAKEALTLATLYEEGSNWMAANMMAMAGEKKEEMMEEMKDDDGEVPEQLFKAAFNYMF